jgi:hypothetical protein
MLLIFPIAWFMFACLAVFEVYWLFKNRKTVTKNDKLGVYMVGIMAIVPTPFIIILMKLVKAL